MGGRATLMRRSPHMRLAVCAHAFSVPSAYSMRTLPVVYFLSIQSTLFVRLCSSSFVTWCSTVRASQAALLESYERQIQSVEGALRVRKAH